MGFDLDIDLSQEKIVNIFHLSVERIRALDKMIAHSRIDSMTDCEWIKDIALKVNTIEELVLVIYMAGKNGGT